MIAKLFLASWGSQPSVRPLARPPASEPSGDSRELSGLRFVLLDRSAYEREELTCRMLHFQGCSTACFVVSRDMLSFWLECAWAHLVASGRSLGFVLLGCPEAHRLEGPEATCSKAESQGSPEASRQGGPEAVHRYCREATDNLWTAIGQGERPMTPW